MKYVRTQLFWAAFLLLGGLFAPTTPAQAEQSDHSELVAVFETARLARAQGRYADAIPVLRDLLRQVPDDAGVREELGYVLLLDGQYAAAQYHFQILAARTPNGARRTLYRSVLGRIVSERPVGVRLVFALVPSSNLNGGADGNTFDTALGTFEINDASRAQEGWKMSVGLAGYLRHAFSARDLVQLDWSATHTRSDADLIEDTRDLSLTVTWQRVFERAHSFASVGVSERRSSSDLRNRVRFEVGAFHALGQRGTVRWSYTQSQTDFEKQSAAGRFEKDQGRSGPLRLLNLRHIWQLPRAQSVWFGLQLEDNDPERASQRYDGRILQLGGSKRFPGGLSMDGVLSYGARDFTGNFGLQAFPRRDSFLEMSISAQHDRINWQGFAPRLTCTARQNRSNISFFTATTQECGFQLTRGF